MVSEGSGSLVLIPNPAAHTSVSAVLRSKAQAADKVEVQEALPPAGVLGAEPLSLMPQHFPREPAKRCFRAMAANQGGDTLTTSFAGGFDSEPGGAYVGFGSPAQQGSGR